ncbi:MAG: PilZ domain-containing protein [Geobacteraceae bacterium]|nr:PilZ domain-containing protein [Geobacteraceae bacterium]NTW78845.1 PilZ domain-containing protein [Geobacteraceae bacterium]
MSSDTENTTSVVNKRNGTRFDYEVGAVLYHNDNTYHCMTKNISITGALVSAQEFPPAALRPGDICRLSLCTEPTETPGQSGIVTRLGPSDVALNFMDFIY